MSGEKSRLRSQAAKAEEEGAALQRRLPQIKADKKAAALAKVSLGILFRQLSNPVVWKMLCGNLQLLFAAPK